MSAIITDLREFRHPGHRVGEDEMQARSLCDIQDPNARIPTHCAVCRAPGTTINPLRLEPVSRDVKDLARAYIYRARCALGCKGRDR